MQLILAHSIAKDYNVLVIYSLLIEYGHRFDGCNERPSIMVCARKFVARLANQPLLVQGE